jgi:glycosyltransferase involved in cell wall biosynthesis
MSSTLFIPALPDKNRDSVNFLCLGALSPQLAELLCQTLSEYLHYANEPTRLVFVADSLTLTSLERLIKEAARLGIRELLDFVKPKSEADRSKLYRMANLLLLTGAYADRKRFAEEATRLSLPIVHLRQTEQLKPADPLPGLQIASTSPEELAPLLYALQHQRSIRRNLIADQYAALDTVEERVWKIEGPFDSSYSLALLNREIARALTAEGVPVAIDITPDAGEPEPDSRFLAETPDMAALFQRARKNTLNEVVLRNTYPPSTAAMQGRIRVMSAYGWEESGFPIRYVRWFNHNLDLITVMSTLVGKILRDAGVRVPIAVVGLGLGLGGGFEIETRSPAVSLPPPALTPSPHAGEGVALRERGDLGKPYRFLHISSCFPRKGVDVLLAAWGKAFRAADPVTLVIKTFPNPHNDVEAQLATCRERDPDYPDVVIINRDLPESEVHALYQHCHAYVAPSRGEGFGLPCLEAMYFGLPLIVTAWGGQRDFVHDDNAWLIDYRFAPARTHLGTEHSAWAEPDLDCLVARLREVYAAPPEVLRDKIERARATAAEYTWANTAARTCAAIAQLEAAPMRAREPQIGWVSSWHCRCGIATYSEHLLSAFPMRRVHIFATHDASQSGEDAANVTRCWRHGETNDLRAALAATALDAIVIQHHPPFILPEQLGEILADAFQATRQTHLFFHNTQAFESEPLKPRFDALVPTLAKVTRIYVHNMDDLNRLKNFGLVDNVTLFPHGIPRFAPLSPKNRQALRRQHKLKNKTVIATYGFLLPHKGARQLIEAVHRLLPEYPGLHLILCCSDHPAPDSATEHQALDELISSLQLEPHITRIHDYLPEEESLQWLQMADLLVFAYQNTEESVSGAIRMGLASRRPIAVTPQPIFDDLGEAVHRLPGTRVDDLVAGLRTWLENPPAFYAQQQTLAPRYVEARSDGWLSQRLLNIIEGGVRDWESVW